MKIFATLLVIALLATTSVADTVIDDTLAARAEVVLRVKWLGTSNGADKYRWYSVDVLQVLKNNSSEQFTRPLSVAAYSWDRGVPDGESTLYLERYNREEPSRWRLLGGGAAAGVSHSAGKE